MFKKILSAMLCACMVVSTAGLNLIQGKAQAQGITSSFLSMVTGVDFESNSGTYYQEAGPITDGSNFSTSYSQSGRSLQFNLLEGHYMETNFDGSKVSQYADAKALVFWLKTPKYSNSVGDLANLSLGLITGVSRWTLCQSPTAGMEITYVSDADKTTQKIPLKSQGGGVFLDAPSDFTGWVIIPLNILSNNAWGTGATTKDFSVAPTLNLMNEWMPATDNNKPLYFDSIGLVKNISAFKLSIGAKPAINMAVGNAFENNGECAYYAPSYVADNSYYTSTYSQKGRAVELSLTEGNQFESYFDSSIVSEYAGAQSLIFWMKTPEYGNPTGDLSNMDLGLICGGTRWVLCQTPTAGMEITYVSDSNSSIQKVPLVSQGGGVYLDAPSNFMGWVVVPLDVLSKNAWGTGAVTKDFSTAPHMNIVFGWTPESDVNKKIYIDSIGLTTDTTKFMSSIGAKQPVDMVTAIDFESAGTCIGGSIFNTTYKEYGRSVEYNLNDGTYFEAYFNSAKVSEYVGSEALVFWLKTPELDNPTGNVANLDLRINSAGSSWRLCQSPTAGMDITYISDVDKSVQNVPLKNEGGVYFDAPNNFTGWAIIPLSLINYNAWGTGATSIDLSSAPTLLLMAEWVPTNDIGKKIYLDSVGLVKNVNSFKSTIMPTVNYNLNSFNVSGNNFITKVQPGTKVSDFTTTIAPTVATSLSYTNLLGETISTGGNVGTGTTVDVTINGCTTVYDIVIYGDVNGDGDIAVGDLVAVKKNLLKVTTLYDEAFAAADVSRNSSVSIVDLLAVKKHILSLTLISQN